MTVQLQAFLHAFGLVLSMICAMGPQNLHVLGTGLRRRHVGATVGLCVAADAVLVAAWMLVWAAKSFRAACRAQTGCSFAFRIACV